MSAAVLEKHGRIALIAVNNPPVNAISHAVREGIIEKVTAAQDDDEIAAIVLSAKGRTFMAGADITEFGKTPIEPGFADVINALEDSAKPVVAAIFGTALGGGLELALACHYRIASKDAKLGLPEVNLGIIPGAQGTQRLPRLVGLSKAIDMITSGKPIGAEEAYAAGLLDAVEDGDLQSAAIAFADRLAAENAPLHKISEMTVPTDGTEAERLDAARQVLMKKAANLHAPLRALDALKAAVDLAFDDGIEREREIIEDLMADPQAKALQHAFFAERKTTHIPDLPVDAKPRKIAAIGVVGGGTMGSGIALACAAAGLPVTLVEQDGEAAKKARKTVYSLLQAGLEKGKLSKERYEAQKSAIDVQTDMAALSGADLIIEAVFERMDVKKQVFKSLDAVAKEGAILATNTSYLNVDEIAATTKRPADVLGLHFFSPANIMKLLEIVRADKTAPDVLATAVKFAKTIAKVPVVARICHGFIGNRMLEGYIRESGLLMLEGAKPEQIDAALRQFGYPMGPLQMGDLAGLDIGHMLRNQFPADRFHPNAYRVMNRLVEMGRKGQKTGAGIYRYEAGDRTPHPDPITDQIIAEEAEKAGVEQRLISDEEIVERCVLPLINEGSYILDEGVALRASDIDVVYLYGYGFPRWRGGPMFYADQMGPAHVLDRIAHYAHMLGPKWWTPAPLLQSLVREGRRFQDLDNTQA